MIISLEEARKIDANVTEAYLNGLEQAIHAYTNNSFVNQRIRFNITGYGTEQVMLADVPFGLREGDTIKLSGSVANDGVYAIETIDDKTITLKSAKFYRIVPTGETVTKVEYPPDVVAGVTKLIAYDKKMSTKLGVKSESIGRMAITYYDVNASESAEGYPKSLVSFLDKYKMLRW